MISNPDFTAKLIGPPIPVARRIARLANFHNYLNYENDWIDYYENIFQTNMVETNQIRLFIAESAPSGVYPNRNYAFDSASRGLLLDPSKDKYLWNYFRGAFPRRTTKISKENALIMLSKENFLIIDLLPTHGIKLETKERKLLNADPRRFADIAKIKGLPNHKGIDFNYVFSVPPSSYTSGFLAGLLPSNYKEYGNVNTGQGHAPSQLAIQNIISKGF